MSCDAAAASPVRGKLQALAGSPANLLFPINSFLIEVPIEDLQAYHRYGKLIQVDPLELN